MTFLKKSPADIWAKLARVPIMISVKNPIFHFQFFANSFLSLSEGDIDLVMRKYLPLGLGAQRRTDGEAAVLVHT